MRQYTMPELELIQQLLTEAIGIETGMAVVSAEAPNLPLLNRALANTNAQIDELKPNDKPKIKMLNRGDPVVIDMPGHKLDGQRVKFGYLVTPDTGKKPEKVVVITGITQTQAVPIQSIRPCQ